MFIIIDKFKIIFIIITILTLFISSYLVYSSTTFPIYESNYKLPDSTIETFKKIYENPEKIAYLTFDDGPTKYVTPKILDILDKTNVKANFFVLGKHVEEFPDILKREYDSGHFIANHGYSHNNSKLYKSKNSFISEIQKTDIAISKAINQKYVCHLFRFPNGSSSHQYKDKKDEAKKYLIEIGYTYVDWNCLNNDSVRKYSHSELLNNLKKTSKNKTTLVILMHDTGDVNKTYDILEDSINYLKSQGYTFKTFHDFF